MALPFHVETLAKQLGWRFTRTQHNILSNPTRFTLISGGNRGGKSMFLARWLALKIIEYGSQYRDEKRPVQDIIGIAWLVGNTYPRTEREFAYLTDILTRFFGRTGPRGEKIVDASNRVDPGQITINTGFGKIVVRTKSASDEQSLVAEAPFAVGVCEAAQLTYSAFLRLQGRIAEERAPMLMAGTLEYDQGWYVDLLKRWSAPAVWELEDSRSWWLRTPENVFLFPDGEDDAEIKRLRRELPEDEFNRQYMGEPAPPRGLVHPSFSMAAHVQQVEYIEGEDILMGVDPGIAAPTGSAYAIEFAHKIDGQIRVFDEIFESDKLEETIIEDILKKKPWWGKSAITGVIDRAGAQRAGAHEASIQVWRRLAGIQLLYTERVIPIADQIRLFDTYLKMDNITGKPGIVFDVEQTPGIQSELGGRENPLRLGHQDQSYKWNLAADGTVIGNLPRDRHCDGIKALIYMLYKQFGPVTAIAPRPKVVKVHKWGREKVYA
tara:strand:+ start:956 stop:2434 length:1479 start_codon:yes stop_codon:yes gene_type:complete